MTEMAGPRGADGGGRGGFNFVPNPAAIAACEGQVEGAACTFGTPPQGGRCTLLPMGAGLTCTPLPGGGIPAAEFRAGMARLRRQSAAAAAAVPPVAEMRAATSDVTTSSSCRARHCTFRRRSCSTTCRSATSGCA